MSAVVTSATVAKKPKLEEEDDDQEMKMMMMIITGRRGGGGGKGEKSPPPTTTTNTKLCESLLCAFINRNSADELTEIASHPDRVLKLVLDNMSPDQKRIFLKIVLEKEEEEEEEEEGRMFMIEGLPGTGKSHLQTAISYYYRTHTDKSVLCVAPTHLVALQQQDGMTIHKAVTHTCHDILRVSNYKIEEELIRKMMSYKLVDNFDIFHNLDVFEIYQKLWKLAQLEGTAYKIGMEGNRNLVIMVDEGTMISNLLFAVLYLTYPRARFVVMYGPNQLPPVSGLPACDWNINEGRIQKYALTTQMRFHSDEARVFREYIALFYRVLNKDVAYPPLTQMVYLFKNLTIGGNLRDYYLMSEKKIKVVSTNKERCAENLSRLHSEGRGPIYVIAAEIDQTLPTYYNVESKLGIDRELKIRRGVSCIYKDNNLGAGLVKGMIVDVVDIIAEEKGKGEGDEGEGNITVKVNANANVKCIKVVDQKGNEHYVKRVYFPTDFEVKKMKKKKKDKESGWEEEKEKINDDDDDDDNNGKDYAMVKQFPLCLSYCITAHSCQGKTFTDHNIGISLKPEPRYQVSYFVAVSRITTPKQLYSDQHPVFWLYPSMNLRSAWDVENLQEKMDVLMKQEKEEGRQNRKEEEEKEEERRLTTPPPPPPAHAHSPPSSFSSSSSPPPPTVSRNNNNDDDNDKKRKVDQVDDDDDDVDEKKLVQNVNHYNSASFRDYLKENTVNNFNITDYVNLPHSSSPPQSSSSSS